MLQILVSLAKSFYLFTDGYSENPLKLYHSSSTSSVMEGSDRLRLWITIIFSFSITARSYPKDIADKSFSLIKGADKAILKVSSGTTLIENLNRVVVILRFRFSDHLVICYIHLSEVERSSQKSYHCIKIKIAANEPVAKSYFFLVRNGIVFTSLQAPGSSVIRASKSL